MRIKYCRKYEKYVSQQHCEFFNEGRDCEYYNHKQWNSIKELLADADRPRWEVSEIIKPHKCSLLDRSYLHEVGRRRKVRKKVVGARG